MRLVQLLILGAGGGCTPQALPERFEGDLLLTDARDLDAAVGVGRVDGDLVVQDADLTELSLPMLEHVSGEFRIWESPSLTTVSAPRLQRVDGDLSLYDDPVLTELELDSLTEVGGVVRIHWMARLPALDWPSLTLTGGLTLHADASLAEVRLPALQEVAGDLDISTLPALREVHLPAAEEIRGVLDLFDNDALQTVSAPRLERLRAFDLHHCDAMTQPGTFDALTQVQDGFVAQYNESLTDLSGMPALARAGSVVVRFNHALQRIDWPLVQVDTALTLANNRTLPSVRWPGLTTTPRLEIQGHEALSEVALPDLRVAEQVRIVNNPTWRTCDIELLLAQVDPTQVECGGNGPGDCTDWCTP